MVRFRILERISIRSYILVTVGTVERPLPVKTYHYLRAFFLDLKRLKGYISRSKAGIAQLVERNLAKVDVAGSSPVSRSY